MNAVAMLISVSDGGASENPETAMIGASGMTARNAASRVFPS